MNLYQEILMDHYKNPRNRGTIENSSFIAEQRNSSCGDEIMCTGTIIENKLINVRFEGKGCVISQAAASLLSEKAKNASLTSINIFDCSTMIELIGMPLGPVRMQCALLSLSALQKGIFLYETEKGA